MFLLARLKSKVSPEEPVLLDFWICICHSIYNSGVFPFTDSNRHPSHNPLHYLCASFCERMKFIMLVLKTAPSTVWLLTIRIYIPPQNNSKILPFGWKLALIWHTTRGFPSFSRGLAGPFAKRTGMCLCQNSHYQPTTIEPSFLFIVLSLYNKTI